MEKINIVKIGGNVVDNESMFKDFVSDFSGLEGPKILVHGGGKIASEVSRSLGMEVQMINGRRITDEGTLRVVTMVYGGLVNKNIVALLQARGCNAIGMTGADGNLIKAHKREVEELDYGYVGDIDAVNGDTLDNLIKAGFCPVVSALTHDGNGQMLNTNADTIASWLSAAAAGKGYEVYLTYCFEFKGVLKDRDNKDSVIPSLNREEYEQLKTDGIIDSGMIPKMDNCFEALDKGVKEVRICHAEDLPEALAPNPSTGTVLH